MIVQAAKNKFKVLGEIGRAEVIVLLGTCWVLLVLAGTCSKNASHYSRLHKIGIKAIARVLDFLKFFFGAL